MRIGNIQDCASCIHSELYGDTVNCNSDNYCDIDFFNRNGRYCAKDCKSYVKKEIKQTGLIEQVEALPFLLAGKAEFVLHSTKTNEDFKFILNKREKLDNKEEYIYFVNMVLAREKIYAGNIVFDSNKEEFIFYQGKKGKLKASDRNIRSLIFVLNNLFNGITIQTLKIYHVGNCGRCGKKLTTPESILTGLGPTCCKNLGIPRKKLK